jgi:hypothetical protein
MHSNCRSALPTVGVSLQQRIEVGMLYQAWRVNYIQEVEIHIIQQLH